MQRQNFEMAGSRFRTLSGGVEARWALSTSNFCGTGGGRIYDRLRMAMHLSAASHQGQNVSRVEYTTDVMVETVQHDLVPCRIWFRSQPTCANGRLDAYH